MKKTVFVLAALATVLIGFSACSNGSSDDNTPTAKEYTVTFGVDGENGELTAAVDGKAITSSARVREGKTVKFTAKAKAGYAVNTWTIAGGAFEADTGKDGSDTASVKVDTDITVKVSFKAAAPVPSVQQSDLYGSYWGSLTMMGKDFPLCLVIEADKVALHSDVMGMEYPLVKYKDEGNGTWTIGCYDDGEDTTKPTTHTTVSVDTKASPFIAKATIIPMHVTSAPLKKGKAYNNEYTH